MENISEQPRPGAAVEAVLDGEDFPVMGVFHPTRARKLWIIDPLTEEVIADESNIISWRHLLPDTEVQ
jgi:hypothetical protein